MTTAKDCADAFPHNTAAAVIFAALVPPFKPECFRWIAEAKKPEPRKLRFASPIERLKNKDTR